MKTLTVASAKGGVGKSSLSAGLGLALAQSGKRTLLIDMDIGVRSLDIFLGVAQNTVYNWGDILDGNCDVDTAILKINENLFLIAAPLDFSENFTEEGLKAVTDGLKDEFDIIIFDAPAGLECGFKLASHCAESCIIVSTPDAVSIRAASCAAYNVRKTGIEDIRLVINRFNKKAKNNVCIDEIIDTVTARLIGIVPESPEIKSFSNGVPIPEKSKGNLAYKRISRRLCGENVPLNFKII